MRKNRRGPRTRGKTKEKPDGERGRCARGSGRAPEESSSPSSSLVVVVVVRRGSGRGEKKEENEDDARRKERDSAPCQEYPRADDL